MDGEMTGKRPGGTRFLKIALGLSLALNLAVAGVVVGALARPDGPGFKGARAPGAATFGAPYMRALSKEQRRVIAAEQPGCDAPQHQHDEESGKQRAVDREETQRVPGVAGNR